MSIYKQSLVTTLIVSTIFSVGVVFAQLKQHPQISLASLQAGEYLSQNYLSRLKETGSPYKASMTDAPQLVIVEQKDKGTRLKTIYNFHEGGPEIVVWENGKVSVPVDAGLQIGTPNIGLYGPNTFALSFHGLSSQRFVFVEKASTIVAEIVLAGKYADNSNQVYTFQKDGHAVFPKHEFSYTIGVDHIVNKFDYFTDNDTGKVYGFRLDGTSLYVYPTSGELGQVEDKEPQFILKRIESKKD